MRYPIPRTVEGLLIWAKQFGAGVERDHRPVINGTVTLTAGATSTVVSAQGVHAGGRVFLSPESSDAVTIAGGHVPVEDIDANKFTVRHSNNASTDRVFYWQFVGRA